MDYLDIAREIAQGRWGAAANAYWGTLYSLFLSPLFLFRVSPAVELLLAHCFAVFMLVVNFLCFRAFLHSCLDALDKSSAVAGEMAMVHLPKPAVAVLGYTLFLWSALILVPIKEIGPDALVSAALYGAGALLLRLQAEPSFLNFAAFGAVLGVGYWAKAVMFPVGILFLGICLVRVRQWKKWAAGVIAFGVVAAPLLASLSMARGRFTFGDSGVLNYATFVSPGGRVIEWQGLPPGSGLPKHATRTLRLDPIIYEFNGPIAGTYTPSYDPAYWNEGHRARFSLRAQMGVIAGHVPLLAELLLVAQPSLVAVFLFLLLWNPKTFGRSLANWWPFLTASCGIIALYTLVHLETRFIGACIVFVWLSAFCALRIPAGTMARRVSTLCMVSAAAAILLSLASYTAKCWLHGDPDSAQTHIEVAQELNLRAGTPVAVIGAGNFSYWAHFARVRIVAEIMQTDENHFWRLAAPEQEKFFVAFRSTGAEWLIAQPPAVLAANLGGGWESIGSTSYYRYSLLRPAETRTAAMQH